MRKAIIYSFAVCLFSWGIYYLFTSISNGLTSNSILMTVFKSVYMFFPMVVALAFQLVLKEKPSSTGFLNFRISWTWLAAVGCIIAAVLVTVPVSALIPGVSLHYGAEQVIAMNGIDESMAGPLKAQLESIPAPVMILSTIISAIIAGCTVNAVLAFGEEYGWRNYMLSALRGQKFWTAALFIGFVWGIWHAPLVLAGHNYPQHPVAGVAMMVVFCILAGIIEMYFTLKTKSVFIAAVIHGTINALAGMVTMLILGGNDLTIGFSGAAGFISISIAIIFIYFYDRKKGEGIMSSTI